MSDDFYRTRRGVEFYTNVGRIAESLERIAKAMSEAPLDRRQAIPKIYAAATGERPFVEQVVLVWQDGNIDPAVYATAEAARVALREDMRPAYPATINGWKQELNKWDGQAALDIGPYRIRVRTVQL